MLLDLTPPHGRPSVAKKDHTLKMGGRFTQTATPDVIAEHFHLDEPPLFKPRYNIAPSQAVAAIRLPLKQPNDNVSCFAWG